MAQSGTLNVRVFTSQAQIPVFGAVVAVARRGGDGKYQLIALRETDRSGDIEPVAVAAPPASESTSPDEATRPFSAVDIWVEHPEYEVVWLRGVQVFAGQQTQQQVELAPFVAGESWTEEEQVRTTPPQSL